MNDAILEHTRVHLSTFSVQYDPVAKMWTLKLRNSSQTYLCQTVKHFSGELAPCKDILIRNLIRDHEAKLAAGHNQWVENARYTWEAAHGKR